MRRAGGSGAAAALWGVAARGLTSVGSNIILAAPGASPQKARSWDKGVATKFSTSPLEDIFGRSAGRTQESSHLRLACCCSKQGQRPMFTQEQVQQMINQALQGLNETWEKKFLTGIHSRAALSQILQSHGTGTFMCSHYGAWE